MLFSHRFHDPIARGAVTRTIRRWRRPQARPGGRYRIANAGSIEVDAIIATEPGALTADDARRSGFESVEALLAAIPARPGATLYRIDFHYLGPIADPRTALAADADLDETERRSLGERLAKMDGRSRSPWTMQTLEQIAAHPGTVSHTLATAIGLETVAFKANVRKLKAFGLTTSLETGYELSPRGHTLLAHLRAAK